MPAVTRPRVRSMALRLSRNMAFSKEAGFYSNGCCAAIRGEEAAMTQFRKNYDYEKISTYRAIDISASHSAVVSELRRHQGF